MGEPDELDDDVAFTIQLIEDLGDRATGASTDGLAHPVVVDAKLRAHMEEATATAELAVAGRLDRGVERAGRAVFAIQRRFNRSLVGSLHQFDHRTRMHEDRLRALEGRIAQLEDELRRRDAGSSPS